MKEAINVDIFQGKNSVYSYVSIKRTVVLCNRGCVSMGATGAMAPMNFQRDAFGTHEILKSVFIGSS